MLIYEVGRGMPGSREGWSKGSGLRLPAGLLLEIKSAAICRYFSHGDLLGRHLEGHLREVHVLRLRAEHVHGSAQRVNASSH